MRKPVLRVSDKSDTNQAVQPQKMARGLKFRIYEVERLYYPCSDTNGADPTPTALISCAVISQLICVFVFTYANAGFLTTRLKLISIKTRRTNVDFNDLGQELQCFL